jgi:hypothetical protein
VITKENALILHIVRFIQIILEIIKRVVAGVIYAESTLNKNKKYSKENCLIV